MKVGLGGGDRGGGEEESIHFVLCAHGPGVQDERWSKKLPKGVRKESSEQVSAWDAFDNRTCLSTNTKSTACSTCTGSSRIAPGKTNSRTSNAA